MSTHLNVDQIASIEINESEKIDYSYKEEKRLFGFIVRRAGWYINFHTWHHPDFMTGPKDKTHGKYYNFTDRKVETKPYILIRGNGSYECLRFDSDEKAQEFAAELMSKNKYIKIK